MTKNKDLDDARSDATAILGSLGVIAVMSRDLEGLCVSGAHLSASKDALAKEQGQGMLAGHAAQMRRTREKVDALLEELGEHHNGGDSCSETVIALSTPVYAILEKRRNGVSLDD